MQAGLVRIFLMNFHFFGRIKWAQKRDRSLGLHPNEKNLEALAERAWLGAGETHSKANMVSSPFHPANLMEASHGQAASGFRQMRLVVEVEVMPGGS